MRIGSIVGKKANCLLCEWECEKDTDEAERALIHHLRAYHDRTMINKVELPSKKDIVRINYEGPSWPSWSEFLRSRR